MSPLAVTIETYLNYIPPDLDTTSGYAQIFVDQMKASDPDYLNPKLGPFTHEFHSGSDEVKDEINLLRDSIEIQRYLEEQKISEPTIRGMQTFFNIRDQEKAKEALPKIAKKLQLILDALDDPRLSRCPTS